MERSAVTIGVRARRTLVLWSCGLAAAIVMTWPLATGLGHLGRTANSGDARFAVWNVAWVAHALVTDPADLFDANIFHPHANALAFSEANLVAGLLAVPAWWLTRNPDTAHNVVLIFSFAASCVTMWMLARRLTGDGWAAATAAVLFAFCPFLFSHTAHIQLLMAAGMPLALLVIHRLADAPTPGVGAALGLSLAVQALACAYYGIFAGFMTAYAALFMAWSRRLWRSPRYWVAVSIAGGLSMLLVYPAFAHYLQLQGQTGFGRSLADATPYSAYLRSYLASAAHAHTWLLPIIKEWNGEVLFPGFLAIALAATGAVSLAHRRVWPIDDERALTFSAGAGSSPRPATAEVGAGVAIGGSSARLTQDRELLLLYGSLGLLAFWASLGPRAGLYTLLFKVVPVFSLLRAPGRTGIVVMLVLALLAGFGVRALRRRTSGRRSALVGAVCCGAALVELNGVPIDWRPSRVISPAYDVLAGMPRGAVAEFPFYERRIDFHIHTIYMINSTRHWQPLLNGYSDYIPPDFRTLAVTLASFPSRESFDALKQRRTRYIVLHRDLYGRETAPLIEARLAAFMTYLRPVAADERVLIFEIVGWPR